MRVIDDGAGLPDGFDLDRSTGLGLSIVRTLVTTELAGRIELYVGDGPHRPPGTRRSTLHGCRCRTCDAPLTAGSAGRPVS